MSFQRNTSKRQRPFQLETGLSLSLSLSLLIRPCEVLSRIANAAVLEVAHDTLGVLLQHRHVIVGRFT